MSRQQQGGWGAVGEALGTLFGGGQARDQAVFQQHLAQTADINRKLALADSARMIALEEHALRNDPTLTPTQRAAVVAGRGADLHNVFRAAGEQQQQGFRQRAADALTGGNADLANAFLAAVHGQPLEITQAIGSGGATINPYRERSPVTITPLGLGEIMADEADARAADALARERLTAADLNEDRRVNPERHRAAPRASGGGDGDTWSVGEVIEIIHYNQIPGVQRVPVPTPGTPKRPPVAAAPVAQIDLPPPHYNPNTGEIFDYDPQSHQWVLRPAQGAPRP